MSRAFKANCFAELLVRLGIDVNKRSEFIPSLNFPWVFGNWASYTEPFSDHRCRLLPFELASPRGFEPDQPKKRKAGKG